ncbi:ComF family protein [Methylomonas sp. LL1]|uniref:ComF family protein n=1 Tax=Methylomonas sp. LL1 TaxID=2785785 RepID=UPI0018C39189|nr:ComF family protein [Methylomonas sp. LL1]QPK65341.1 ComF family protein [Methylomonas sp. LL1]
MNNWLNIIQNKLLPPCCILCGQAGFAGLDLCKACFDDLPRNLDCCYRCGQPFDMAISAPQLCGRCLRKSPSFDETHAPFLYDDSLRYLITQLKFHRHYKHARLLGTLLARYLAETAELPECIIPVPLHRNRYRQRGFNQAIEIARHLSSQLSIPLLLNACIRDRDTAHQTELPAKQRLKNMRRAFSAAKPLAYQHVAIVDDVMTTGATIGALAIELKRQGVNRVDVWVCARA